MTNATKQSIVNAAQAFINTHGLSNAHLAKRANVRAEYLTHMFREGTDFTIPNGTAAATPIADKYFERIALFIGHTLTESFWQDKPTDQLISMISILADLKTYGETGIITGDTGSGKTHTIGIYTRQHPADTFVVTVGSSDTLGDLIDKVCDELKLTTGKTKGKKLTDIARKMKQLREDGLRPQLLFDEAEYMKAAALCSIKQLYDHLHKYASIVLVGTSQLQDNLETLRKRNKPGIPQFYRRVKFGIRTLPYIDRSYALFTDGLTPDVIKYLRALCDNYGELHDVLVPVRRESQRTGDPITVGMINRTLNIAA